MALADGDGTFAAAQYSKPATGDFSSYAAHIGDFNGDGVSDLVAAYDGPGGLSANVSLANGDGTLAAAQYSKSATGDFSSYAAHVGDFDGDGISDLVWTKSDGSGLYAQVALANGDGTLAAAVGELLGLRGPCGGFRRGRDLGPGLDPRPRDLLRDLLGHAISCSKKGPWWTPPATDLHRGSVRPGGAFERQRDPGRRPAQQPELRIHRSFPGYGAGTGDFDGDGLADLVWAGALTTSTETCSATRSVTRSVAHRAVPRRPGKDRPVLPPICTGGLYAYTAVAEPENSPEDFGLVSAITSATGPSYALDYAPLTDGDVYTKDTGGGDTDNAACALPCLDLQAPLYAVEELTTDHGSSLTHRMTYRYGGLKADVEGRGLLGFRWMKVKDEVTGVFTSSEYAQEFPHIGEVSAISWFLDDGTVLSAEENTWSALALNDGKTRFPYVSESVAETYELDDGPDNEPVTTVTTTRSYDDYGNVTLLTLTTAGAGGPFARTTTSSYTNDTANWLLGLPSCARAVSTAPGQAARTRTSGFAYDATTGLLIKGVIEPRASDVAGCASTAAGAGLTLVTAYSHDGFGNRTTATLSGPGLAARTTTTVWGEHDGSWALSANGRFPVKRSNALGHSERRRYDGAHGVLVRLEGPNGLETAWEYDGFGRAVRETRADGGETAIAYLACTATGVTCPAGAVLAVRTETTGAPTRLRYLDRRGLAVRLETEGFEGSAVYQDSEYDALGRLTRRSRPYYTGETAEWTSFTHDEIGRVTRETRPDGSWTDRVHDGLVDGKLRQRLKVFATGSAAGDAAARILTRDGDALGRVVKLTDPLGNATGYTYDALGNLLSVSDAKNNLATRGYDLRGRRTGLSDPDLGDWTYSYNALGELAWRTDAKGRTVSLGYDALGRLRRRTEAEGTTTWIYDGALKGKGRLHLVIGPDGYMRRHAYDHLGRPASETLTIAGEDFTISRTYDGASRLARLTYPETGVALGRTYTATGYAQSVYDVEAPATVYWTAQTLNAEGMITEAALGNGIGTSWTYDAETGLIETIQSGTGDTAGVQDLGYVFDSFGNLTAREDFLQDVYEQFTFDDLNRLTGATVYDADDDSERAAKTYSFDAIGNIVNKSDVGAADYVYGTGNAAGAGDAGPHAVISAGGNTYAYDDNGNMTSGAGRTIAWTGFNKPRTVADATTATTFDYGPERARIRQTKVQGATTTTITYVAGLFEQIAKTGAATKYVHYIFAAGTRIAVYTTDDAPSPSITLRYLHRDHLGSVDTITGPAGAVIERLSYDAFGKRRTASGTEAWKDAALAISATETPRGFTDHEHLDDFQLVHMNGRVYDPHLGRFMSADPFIRLPAARRPRPSPGPRLVAPRRPGGAENNPHPPRPSTSAPPARPVRGAALATPGGGWSGLLGPRRHRLHGTRVHAEPFIRLPVNAQGLNRYTYALNNPLSFTDPSGYAPAGSYAGGIAGHLAGLARAANRGPGPPAGRPDTKAG